MAIQLTRPGNKQNLLFDVVERLQKNLPKTARNYILSKLLYDLSIVRKDNPTAYRACMDLGSMKQHPKLKKLVDHCKKNVSKFQPDDKAIAPAAIQNGKVEKKETKNLTESSVKKEKGTKIN